MTNNIEKSNSHIKVFDPFQESINNLLVVAFPKSNSKYFPFALSIAQTASHYAVKEISGKQMHFVAFAPTQTDAGKASALLNYVNKWKGTMIFAGGKLISNIYGLLQVIECFLESCACWDSKAHCQLIIDDPFAETDYNLRMTISVRIDEEPPLKQEIKIDRYSFPCKYLFSYFMFQGDHPSSPKDQIQAAGVSRGCNFCPHFNPEDFKLVGTRIVLKEFYE